MDVNAIVEVLGNVAFPIAAFVMLFYYNTKTVEDLRAAVDNNTLVITKLIEQLSTD